MSSTLSALLAANPRTASQLTAAMGLYLFDPAAVGTLRSAAALIGELLKAISTTAASTNSTGNLTLAPGVLAATHIEATAVTGLAGTRIVILTADAGRAPGARLIHRVALPAVSGIVLEWRNATAGGALLTSLATDGSGDDAVVEAYFDGTAWQFLRFSYPANS